jgi:hypothetical protein
MKRFPVAVLLTLALASSVHAQEFRATISGTVTDATGSVVSGARITVSETRTATRNETVSDTGGHYVVPFLLPGDYEVSAKLDGFKEFVRKSLHLGAGEQPQIDIHLEVGESRQIVEVTADAPLLNSENASVGQTITTREVEDLPINGGTPIMMASLAMGVNPTSQPTQVLPFASGGGASWSIAGSPNQTSELLVDGVPNTTWDGRLAYSPPQDAVQEVRVKAFDSDAAYGHTGSGTINQVLRSGTNSLHGSVYWKNQPSNLVANNFFNNKTGLPTQDTQFNQYGVTGGGPLFIPRILDARNRLFWFFAFEGVKSTSPNTTFLTVPSDAYRQGDFSALLKLATPTVIYDPYSAVQSGTAITRTAYPSNRIPSSRFNPIALKYLEYYPKPNIASARADGFENYGNNDTTRDGFTNELGRLDINISAKHRTYFNVRHTDYYQTKNNYFANLSTGSNLSRSNIGGSVDHVWMVNSSNVVNIRANFTRMFEDHSAPSAGFDPAEIGFPGYLAANSQYLQLPYITFASNSFQALGMNGADRLPSQSLQLFGTWNVLKGRHSLRIGADARQYRLNNIRYGSATGNLAFSANTWVRAGSSASSTVAIGQDMASFLLGLPTGGSFDINSSAMYYAYYGAVFIHDDFRVRRDLTVNLGLRYDRDFPWHEKWGRAVNGFALNQASPLQAAAQAAYAKSPNALLPAADFKVPGGLTFASPQDSALYENTSHLVSPRIGFAWTPAKLGGKTVLRGGLGLFVAPVTIATLQISGSYSTTPLALQSGFSQATSVVPTNNNYLTPYATLGNPFPTGIDKPAGSSAGLLTFAGQYVTFYNPEVKSPYSVRWNFSIQHALSPNTTIEAAYIGNHGVHLPVTYTQLNGIPVKYLSTLPTRDQPAINVLTANTPNPFFGLQTSTRTNTSISVAQLLSRYPQFPVGVSTGVQGSTGVVMFGNNVGSSIYHSLNVRLQRRLSRGFSLTWNFIQSKVIDQTSWLNESDPQPERRVSPFFRPTRVTSAATYELPIGRGKRLSLGSKWMDSVFGGWNLTGIYSFQLGGPLPWINGSTNNIGDYIYYGGDLKVQPRNVDSPAFDVSRFNTNNSQQFQYHLRTFSTTFGNVRSDGINNFDTSILKRFDFAEKKYFQVRFEVFNVLNHPVFGAPNLQPANLSFGMITSQANRPRMIQLQARFVF